MNFNTDHIVGAFIGGIAALAGALIVVPAGAGSDTGIRALTAEVRDVSTEIRETYKEDDNPAWRAKRLPLMQRIVRAEDLIRSANNALDDAREDMQAAAKGQPLPDRVKPPVSFTSHPLVGQNVVNMPGQDGQ
ncbi:hypothetical protein BB934_45570 (plasmid) [Microvirga ossetica]|uniref:Uncharacterized protein n=1 Tax=Microvirga ossetica TaxID=1882682 RepID=A0A1B2EZY2_9HYPH|nr:hypothetical protein [Microvirga ossetica]ANY85492.1 hypothetical protein BB934_45570 [Microvirga ossetica]